MSFVEPYFLGYRLALGLDIFAKETTSTQYVSYLSKTYGGNIRFGIPITDSFSSQVRYSAYRQEITLPSALHQL